MQGRLAESDDGVALQSGRWGYADRGQQESNMVTCSGPSAYGSQSGYPASSGGNKVSALQGRIQQARVQLNDWTSCVSAKSPKGQAEIQKLSGEISADKQKIARAQSQGNISAANTQNGAVSDPTASGGRRGVFVDAWA